MVSNSISGQGHFATPLGIPIGSQTYPHRQRIIDGNFAGLCKDLAAIGIRDIEICDPSRPGYENLADGKQVKNILDDHGLTCSSGHFTLDVLRARQHEMIAWAKEIGITQIGTSTLNGEMHNGVATMDAVKRAADEYNKISAEAAKAGIQQFLHDEQFEMATIERDGRRVYTVLLDLLDPGLVKMQFQMSAMTTVGDPIMYFNKYPGRFTSMHVQGVDLDDPSSAWKVAVGKDSLNWAQIFKAAKAGGLKNYFVELNWDLTKESVAYLKTLNV
jgi:sugar phosphate isomerase/epimerase